jgi:hypothetical protein
MAHAHFACWKSEATNEQSEYVTHSFSTATLIETKRLNECCTFIFCLVLTSFVKIRNKYNGKNIQRIIEDKLVLEGGDGRNAEEINKH